MEDGRVLGRGRRGAQAQGGVIQTKARRALTHTNVFDDLAFFDSFFHWEKKAVVQRSTAHLTRFVRIKACRWWWWLWWECSADLTGGARGKRSSNG